MSKNMVEPDRPQRTIWRRVACRIIKATRAQAHARASVPTPTYTHTQICNTYCFAMATMVAWMRLIVTSHVHCLSCCALCLYFCAQVRDDMRTAGVMPSEELISKPDSGERSPCSFDISKAEREMELWCWAKGHHPHPDAAVPEKTSDNCSNHAGTTGRALPVNDTETEPYSSDKQRWMWELRSCGICRTSNEREELWNYPTKLFYTEMKSGEFGGC